jgi:hypothetical protein
MMFYFRAALLGLTVFILGACAGRDFVRPTPEKVQLGQTTYSQVVQQFGEPRSKGNLIRNGKNIKSITYSYLARLDEPLEPGVIPWRGMIYYFLDDVLVGHQFTSSFKSDNSNFDETKVGQIEKGKTSRAEVIQLLGKPSGLYIEPMVKSETGEAINYLYQTTIREPFSGTKIFRKSLRVSFDAKDLVSEVDFFSNTP